MQAIEFEATSFQHTIRIPDEIPDGVSLRVLLLVDETKTNISNGWKNRLGTLPNLENEQDFARENDAKRQAALAHIVATKVDWQGKPIPDRDALYDDARD